VSQLLQELGIDFPSGLFHGVDLVIKGSVNKRSGGWSAEPTAFAREWWLPSASTPSTLASPTSS